MWSQWLAGWGHHTQPLTCFIGRSGSSSNIWIHISTFGLATFEKCLRFQNLLHVSLGEKTHEMFRERKWWSYFVGHHCEMTTSGEQVLIWKTMGHECKRDVFMDSSSTFGSHLQTPAFICYTKKLFHILSHQIIYHTGGRLWLVGFCLESATLWAIHKAWKIKAISVQWCALPKEGLAVFEEGIRTNFQP